MPDNNNSNRLFIGTKEAAELLGIGLNKVKKLAKLRYMDFPAVRDGGKYYINRELLSEWSKRITQENIDLWRLEQ